MDFNAPSYKYQLPEGLSLDVYSVFLARAAGRMRLSSVAALRSALLIWTDDDPFSEQHDEMGKGLVIAAEAEHVILICMHMPQWISNVAQLIKQLAMQMEFNAPCRTTKYPREVPPLPWYRQTVPQMLMAGFLPFSAIYIELYYIFASVWGHKVYTIYPILFIVFIILVIVTAFITIALTYFQLAVEDHRWWWRSFMCGGSTGGTPPPPPPPPFIITPFHRWLIAPIFMSLATLPLPSQLLSRIEMGSNMSRRVFLGQHLPPSLFRGVGWL